MLTEGRKTASRLIDFLTARAYVTDAKHRCCVGSITQQKQPDSPAESPSNRHDSETSGTCQPTADTLETNLQKTSAICNPKKSARNIQMPLPLHQSLARKQAPKLTISRDQNVTKCHDSLKRGGKSGRPWCILLVGDESRTTSGLTCPLT